MQLVLHKNHVLVTSVKLDNAVVGRYLSLQDNEFVDCVVADIKQFVNRSRNSKSVLVFPPVNNYRRFLIHKVSEDYSEDLCTFSIGQGHGRRTVVCFKRHLIRDINQIKTDVSIAATSQLSDRPKVMGVDRQQLTGQSTSAPVRDSNAKRAKAVPTVGIYRPPALRRTEEQNTAAIRPSSPVTDAKPERTRSARQRRPDIQVYVPRAKRLSCGEQDRTNASSQQGNSSFSKTKGRTLQQDTGIEKTRKSKSVPSLQQSGGATSARTWNDEILHNAIEESASSVIPKQHAHSPQLIQSQDIGDFGVGEGLGRRSLENSPYEYLPVRSGHISPTNFDAEKLLMDYSADSSCKSDISGSTTSQFQEMYNVPVSCNKKNKLVSDKDVPMLAEWKRSESIEFTENFLDEVGVDQALTHRSSRSSSAASTPVNSGRNSPSSLTDNGGQMWDYFSEIKNATNSSYCRTRSYEMDVQNIPSNNEIEESNVLSEHSEKSKSFEDSGIVVKECDDSDQFLDCSTSADDEKFLNYGDNCAHGDTEVSKSLRDCENFKLKEEKLQEDILVSDECQGHKKDDDDDCRVQEVQNRKNRRIIRGNFVSDVLIISDPEPVTSLPPQNDITTEKASPPNGVLTKKKKMRHKGDSVLSPKVQSPEKQKQSSNAVSVTLNPDECTWDMMFDDNGECLDPKLMEELTSAVGSVAIEKPQSDYRSYQSRVELIMSGAADDEFSHVLEIYNFPPEFKTHDLYAVFSPYMKGGFEIKWVDDTHALGVFSSSNVAAEVLATNHPFVKTRPLQEATHESRVKARRSAEFLQPYRPRPETCAALARRLVTGALGVKLNTTPEEREAERKILKEAREKKRLAARQRDEAWEGTLGEK